MHRKNSLILIIICCFSIVGLVMAEDIPALKVATVDITQIILNSPDINKLKAETQKQAEIINNYIETAKADLENEVDIKKRKIKEDNYNIKLNKKRLSFKQNYQRKIMLLDLKIQSQIAKFARKNNYDLVFSQSAVLYGGDDITDKLIKTSK